MWQPNFCIDSQVRDELADFSFTHVAGVTFSMKENKMANPGDIGLLSAQAEVLNTYDGPHLIQEFGLGHKL